MKLWEKDIDSDALMQRLTVGEDPKYDAFLVRWDCIGSAAQAKILCRAGILSNEECEKILGALHALLVESDVGKVPILESDEDCHTTIERILTERLGDIGKKIHTGRSRNDQVITALRLFMRNLVLSWSERLLKIAAHFDMSIDRYGMLPLPGYTHLQPAMPSSIAMWLHAFMEGTLELVRFGLGLLDSINRNPLGASAGFGSSLPLDRGYGSMLLGFSGPQRSFVDIQNSRGRYEEQILFWASQIGGVFEKYAWDVELYATREFGYVTLPDTLTTGSSIMPQKKNPDIVELLRARSAMMRGYLSQLQWVTAKLPSNYHRDLQLSKGPFFTALFEMENLFHTVDLIVPAIIYNQEALQNGMHNELYATYAAYRKVKEGVPFRDAYKTTAKEVQAGMISAQGYENETGAVHQEVMSCVREARAEAKYLADLIQKKRSAIRETEERIFRFEG